MLFSLLLYFGFTNAIEFGFFNIFNDYMVLQRYPSSVEIFGKHPFKGDIINITLQLMNNNTIIQHGNAIVNDNNTWNISLEPIRANIKNEYEIIAFSSTLNETINIKHILFGDVFICAGEGNMELTLSQSFNSTNEINNASNYKYIRLFSVNTSNINSNEECLSELNDRYIMESWSIVNTTTINNGNWTYFSSLCWYFGKNLYNALDIPIGLISISKKDSSIIQWISNNNIQSCNINSNENNPSIIYNSIICPFMYYNIKGMLWYQGESDTNLNYCNIYECILTNMINEYRFQWNILSNTNKYFGFGIIQLSSMNDVTNNTCLNSGLDCFVTPLIRNAQFNVYNNTINTFFATAIDLGDYYSPYSDKYSRYKSQIGNRISNSILASIYNISDNNYLYPVGIEAYMNNQDDIQIKFNNINNPFILKNNVGFEVFDNDTQSWLNVDNGQVVGFGNNIVISMFAIHECYTVSKVRYNYYESPCNPMNGIYNCAIYDSLTLLPALPFDLDIINAHPRPHCIKKILEISD